MNKYRVVLIALQGYLHALCFAEVVSLLKSSITDLGYDCDYSVNIPAPDRINIIVGYNLLPHCPEVDLSECRYIVFQLEQNIPEKYEGIFKNALDVWDYSQTNIRALAERGIPAKYLTIGYHPVIRTVPPGVKKDIDVFFYGNLNARRVKIIDDLDKAGVNVQYARGIYGRNRDAVLARSKIVLNVHYHPQKIFEAVRVSYLLNNGCYVVSEESVDYPYAGVSLCQVAYNDLVETCRQVLAMKYLSIEEIGEANRVEFERGYPMTKLLENVLPCNDCGLDKENCICGKYDDGLV
jgi:hypothetical protein